MNELKQKRKSIGKYLIVVNSKLWIVLLVKYTEQFPISVDNNIFRSIWRKKTVLSPRE